MTIADRYQALVDYVRRGLVEEYRRSPDLQREFVTAEDYAAYTLAMVERNAGVLSAWRRNIDAAEAAAALERAGVRAHVH